MVAYACAKLGYVHTTANEALISERFTNRCVRCKCEQVFRIAAVEIVFQRFQRKNAAFQFTYDQAIFYENGLSWRSLPVVCPGVSENRYAKNRHIHPVINPNRAGAGIACPDHFI